jgi:hypothetical protein
MPGKTEEITENLSQHSQYSAHNLNWVSPEYTSSGLALHTYSLPLSLAYINL